MRKICVALFAAMLSVFALNALPDNQNGNDSISTSLSIEKTEPVKASLDSIQRQISSALDKMDEIKTMFGQDVDKLNVKIAILSNTQSVDMKHLNGQPTMCFVPHSMCRKGNSMI